MFQDKYIICIRNGEKVVKETIPDEKVEVLRDNCKTLRDRAMIDFLLSTGIRVGELVRLNIDDIDFFERYGKGDKERRVYFDAKTKVHLMNYIDSRKDNNKALFVALNRPHNRLAKSGVELRLREIGQKVQCVRFYAIMNVIFEVCE